MIKLTCKTNHSLWFSINSIKKYKGYVCLNAVFRRTYFNGNKELEFESQVRLDVPTVILIAMWFNE